MKLMDILDMLEQELYIKGYSREKDVILFAHLLAVKDLIQVSKK